MEATCDSIDTWREVSASKSPAIGKLSQDGPHHYPIHFWRNDNLAAKSRPATETGVKRLDALTHRPENCPKNTTKDYKS